MLVYDTYREFPGESMLDMFPRVTIELYPGKHGRWFWEVHVRTSEPVWTHWHNHDGQRWGLTRAIRAAKLVGYEVEEAAHQEQQVARGT